MSYNYSKLKGRIVEKCGNQQNFAKSLGLSQRSLSLKLSNKRDFRQNEIERSLKILELKEEDVQDYFFTKNVQ